MQGIIRLALFGAALFGAFARADEPASALEFWFYRPLLPIKWTPSESARDISLGGGTTAFGSRGLLTAKNMRWEDGALRVDSLSGALTTDRLASEATILGVKQQLFSFRNVRVDMSSRGPLELTLPDEIRLKTQQVDGRMQFVLADDGFKNHIDAQIDSLFQNFDKNFTEPTLSGELSDLARQWGGLLLKSAKSHLIDQARDEFKKSMTREQLAKSLVMGTQSMPEGLPQESMKGDWVFRRIVARTRSGANVTLWRLAPASAPRSGNYSFPSNADARNVLTVVASSDLIQDLSQKSFADQAGEGKEPSVGLGADESALIARVFGFAFAPGAKLELMATGEPGPKFKAWMHRTQSGAASFSDVVWTLREQGTGTLYRLGLIVEFVAGDKPRLKTAFLLGEKPRPLASAQELELLRAVTDPRLNALYDKWGTGNAQLKSMGIRAIGLLDGTRSSGPGFVDQWAQSIGIDFQMLEAR